MENMALKGILPYVMIVFDFFEDENIYELGH